MAIRVATTTGETRAISIREAISTTETRAISIREAISTSATREILAPPVVVLGPFGRLIADATMLTAAHFMTNNLDQDRKYWRNLNDVPSHTGSTIAEYLATGAAADVPLVRALQISTGNNTNFRQFGGNNTPNGIDITDRAWSAWTTGRDQASMYLIDITGNDFMVWAANGHNNHGGSFINFGADRVYTNRHQNGGTFASEVEWRSYLTDLRGTTTPHEIIVAIASDESFVPTFP